jgi:hypothetical protein
MKTRWMDYTEQAAGLWAIEYISYFRQKVKGRITHDIQNFDHIKLCFKQGLRLDYDG